MVPGVTFTMLSVTAASVLFVVPLLTSAFHLQHQSHQILPEKRDTTSTPNTYTLCDVYIGATFFTEFVFETFADGDPTHGRVNYVNKSTAIAKGLATVYGTSFIMRADDTTVLNATGPGRDSVRIKSVKQYTTHLAV